MKDLKKIAFIIIIMMSIIAIVLILVIQFSKKSIIDQGDSGEDIYYDSSKIEDVTDKVRYFTVSTCITKYFNQIDKENFSYYEMDQNGKYVLAVEQSEINQDNYNLLSTEYIEKNNITIDNVNQYIDDITGSVIYTPLEMKVSIDINAEKYITYGFIQNTQNEFIKEVYLIVNLDSVNKTFSIEPLLDEYNSIDEIEIKNKNLSIERNENNTFTDVKINYEYMSKAYFNTYKRMCLSNPTIAYKYLDNEYKEKRFSGLDNFKEYIEKNRKELTGITIKEYIVDNKEDYTEYVCKDQYGNLYIFKEKNINEFSILLDTYTITTDKFAEEYKNANSQKKVMLNADKWIQMLNNRDYEAAFNVLDETFRNNNFNGDVNEFESFMRTKYPGHYEVQYIDFSEQAGGIYTQGLALSEIGTESTSSEQMITVIMKLQDDMNFTMSFTKDS